MDPLGLLRDTKLQHSLPLASAYAALLDYPPTNEQLKRQRARLDPVNREPLFTNFNKWVLSLATAAVDSWAKISLMVWHDFWLCCSGMIL